MSLEPADIYRALLEAAPDPIVVCDHEGRIALVNRRLEDAFGYAREELIGAPIERLMPEAVRAGHRRYFAGYAASPRVRGMGVGRQLVAERRDGRQFPVEISLSPLETANGLAIIAILRDVSERLRADERIRFLSSHDVLTGSYNRAHFEEQLHAFESRGQPVAILVIDVDGLKERNDSLGHHAGDALLKDTAALLRLAFRGEDVVARIGGDEFAVLLPDTGEAAAAECVARLQGLVERHNAEHPESKVSFAVGLAAAGPGSSLENALREADRRMYEQKRGRRRDVTSR